MTSSAVIGSHLWGHVLQQICFPQNTFSKSFPVSTALEVEPQGSSKCFNYEPTKEQMQATWTGLFWLVWPCVPVCLAGFIRICWPGVIINSTTLPKSLVWMMNYTGVLLVTKCTMFDVHCKYRVQITGSAGSLAFSLALQRGETTSEHTGGMWFSEATHPPGQVLSFAPRCQLHTLQMKFLKTVGLKIRHSALEYKAKETSGSLLPCLTSSFSSRFLHSTNICRVDGDSAGWGGPPPFSFFPCQDEWNIPR